MRLKAGGGSRGGAEGLAAKIEKNPKKRGKDVALVRFVAGDTGLLGLLVFLAAIPVSVLRCLGEEGPKC
jgi:hypothetical protein